MPAEQEETPPIRRGKGLRLSTEQPAEQTAADQGRPASAAAPPQRRRGLRLSTGATDAATPAEEEAPIPGATPTGDPAEGGAPPVVPADEVPIVGAAPQSAGARPAPTRTPDASGERWRIATARGPLSYLRGGQGRPLVLLHGFGATARIWGPTSQALAGLRTCYALDMPGCGASPPRGEAPTLQALTDEVVAFVDALGLESFDLLGHSLGAAVAAMVAGRQPRRVGRMVVANLGVRTFAPELAALGLTRGALDLTLGLARPLLDLWQPVNRAVMQTPPMALSLGSLVLNGPPASADQWRGYLADHAATDPRAYVTSLAAPGDPALHEAMRAVVAPTLCVVGRADRVARIAETITAHELLAGSRLMIIEGCGHIPMLERPTEFQLAVQSFLN